jgi:hypothetical protein
LSTVSGGGYIGSWFTAWIHRHEQGAAGVIEQLNSMRDSQKIDPECEPIHCLREYSQYLTPKWGLLSADTWTWVAIYLRNLFLNWLVIIPLFAAILAVPRLWLEILRIVPAFTFGMAEFVPYLLLVLGMGLAVLAIMYITHNLPNDSEQSPGQRSVQANPVTRDEKSFLRHCLLPLFGSAVFLTTLWIGIRKPGGISKPHHWWFITFILFGVVIHLFGCAWYVFASRRKFTANLKAAFSWEGVGSIALIVLAGAAGGIFLWRIADSDFFDPEKHLDYAVAFGPPLLLLIFVLATAAYIGIASHDSSDADREWWARANGWMLVTAVFWAVLSWLILFGPGVIVDPNIHGAIKGLITSIGGASALVTLFLAPSSSTAANKTQGKKAGWAQRIKSKSVSLAAPVFAALIIVGIAGGTEWVVQIIPLNGTSRLLVIVVFIVVTALGGLLMGWFVNVNKFSLHGAYRDRLIRAYLGASNKERNPNRFTGFDPNDNLPIYMLQKGRTGKFERPLHVINITLNLVGGRNLAWQQRKAESFTVTPLHSGCERIGYRRSELYGGERGPAGGDGISLGTALTISGAAASPNSGYHSSPVATFLMALFNLRLGAWLGNPGEHGNETFRNRAPRFAAWRLLEETFGLTTDEKPYVFLSDGGHFDNLGIYEMVLRRCRIIVVSDAGCDPKCELEDLGNALRKIRIDLGVPIDFENFSIYSRESKKSGKRWAIGRIRYSAIDNGNPDEQDGVLVYLKPAVYGDGKDPIDVFNYAAASISFPHETTADQWFSESQFESYRILGRYTVEDTINELATIAPQATGFKIFLAALCPSSVGGVRIVGHDDLNGKTKDG